MKFVKNILPLIVLIAASTSCQKGIFGSVKGKGPNVTEIRSVTGFNKIKLDMDADITYVQDADYYVEISAQANVLEVIRTDVSAGELRIDTRKWVRRHSNINIIVHSPDIVGLRISGSGNITTSGTISTTYMDLHISGSGNITLAHLATPELESSVSGSGNIKVSSGTSTNAKAAISGSGDIDLLGITSVNANAKISGSGSILIHVTTQLDATISGSGNIKYAGSPTVNTHISGSGSVIHI